MLRLKPIRAEERAAEEPRQGRAETEDKPQGEGEQGQGHRKEQAGGQKGPEGIDHDPQYPRVDHPSALPLPYFETSSPKYFREIRR